MEKVKLLVVGSGSIGKRHIRNALHIGIPKENILAMDTREDRLEEVKKLGIKLTFDDFDKAIKQDFDAGIICSPTSLHIKHSTKLAELKKHLLIEKPLSANLEGVKNLKKIIEENNLTTMIAYVFRLTPSIKFVKEKIEKNEIGKILYLRGEFSEYLPDWHPYEDYRTFYMARKDQGGGSILDQCHIMDLAHYLVGEFNSVSAINLKISNLEVKADDISEMIIKHKNGVVSSIHTDIFGRSHKKYLEIKGEKGNIFWDFYKNEVHISKEKNKKPEVFNKFEKDFNMSYIEELKHFIECFKNEKQTKIPLEEGIETMRLILAAEESQISKKEENLKKLK